LIKGIIFDLGSTLLRFPDDYRATARAGAEQMADWFLKKKHVKLDRDALVEVFLARRAAGYQQANQTHTEVTAQASLRVALQEINAPATAEAMVEAAVKIYFEPEEARWERYPDTEAALKQLAGQNLKLGLFSNATDDLLVQRLVNRHKLRPWLSPVFSSAGWGWRKPMPEPLHLIAGCWGLPPGQIVMVGDTLNADILGAHQAGMRSILVTMDEAPTNADNRHITPTAVAGSLAQAAEIILSLRHGNDNENRRDRTLP
jgi:putative hydrolase of the HAD superfamily